MSTFCRVRMVGVFIQTGRCRKDNGRNCLCIIKLFRGAGVVTPPSPPRTTFAFTHLPFKMFLERSLNDPHPHHPTSSIFHCYPPPHPPPLPSPPQKILIIHLDSCTVMFSGFLDAVIKQFLSKEQLLRDRRKQRLRSHLTFQCCFFIKQQGQI